MIRRFSIVLNPLDATVLYSGADAQAAKDLIRDRKASGEAVAGWINVRPEKRFGQVTPSGITTEDVVEDDGDDLDIEQLKEIAKGDKRKSEVKEAINRLEGLGIE